MLKAEKRQSFDEILFKRIRNIVYLRMDHNMIDNEMIYLIATQWNHCLKLLEIDCRYAYRNFQFSYDRPGEIQNGNHKKTWFWVRAGFGFRPVLDSGQVWIQASFEFEAKIQFRCSGLGSFQHKVSAN